MGKPEAVLVRPSPVEGHLSDAELRRFVAGPYPSILHVVALAADSWAAAEDAVHEALARAWERGGIEHLDRWVLAVALNLSRSRWRKVGRERPLSERPLVAASDNQEDVDLRQALGDLPRRQREAVVLHYLLDLPVAEVASLTGLSEGGVKHALFRGRRSLAVALGGDAAVDGESVAGAVAGRVDRRRRRRAVVRGTAVVVALLAMVPIVARIAGDRGERVDVASGTVDGLLGRTFVSVSATEGGEPFPLAPGTRLTLTFTLDRWLRADAGCNGFGGRVAEESRETIVLERGEMHSTSMDCPDLRAQETWFGALLGNGPTVVHGGGRLVLTAGARRVEFTESGVDAARHLIGPTWEIVAVYARGDAPPVSLTRPATMAFTESGFRIGSPLCVVGVGIVEWGGATLRVGGWRDEGTPCDAEAEQPAVFAALETGRFLVEVSESHTTLRNAAGRGVVLRRAA